MHHTVIDFFIISFFFVFFFVFLSLVFLCCREPLSLSLSHWFYDMETVSEKNVCNKQLSECTEFVVSKRTCPGEYLHGLEVYVFH
jgi:hypothetical protein